MAFFLYDIFLHAALPALLPYFLLKMIFTANTAQASSSASVSSRRKRQKNSAERPSCGCTRSASARPRPRCLLVKILKQKNPGVRVVFSTVTATGNAVAKQDGASFIDALIYFPLDFGWAVRRVVRSVRPSFLWRSERVLAESLDDARWNSVPVIVVNGVISERSAKGYKRLAFLFSPVFDSISFFCAMTKQDAARAAMLGIKEARIAVSGNLKFDTVPPELTSVAKDSIRKNLGIGKGVPVIVAGSTHRGKRTYCLPRSGG